MRAAIITVSTSRSAGGEDESGPLLAELAAGLGAEVLAREVIPDERLLIEERLRHWSDDRRCELVLTTGGTGVAPGDITPEATRAVVEREVPGIAEAMREASRAHTRHWMLSRGVAGIRGSSLIINFPGSPASIAQAGRALADALPHAIALLTGAPSSHQRAIAPVPVHLGTVTPRLVVRDAPAAIEFYRDAFGAEEIGERFTADDGELVHAELRIGDALVMITEGPATGGAPAKSPASLGGAVTAIMATYWEDVDSVWKRALAAGADVIFPLAGQFYGERSGRLRDPFGQQWMLSQRIATIEGES